MKRIIASFLYLLTNPREFKRMCLFSKSFTLDHSTECKSFVYDYVSSFFFFGFINKCMVDLRNVSWIMQLTTMIRHELIFIFIIF